jgi:hypothetical protein
MDHKNSCKSIKDKGRFYFKFLFQPNRTKNNEMRGNNQKLYHFEQPFLLILEVKGHEVV